MSKNKGSEFFVVRMIFCVVILIGRFVRQKRLSANQILMRIFDFIGYIRAYEKAYDFIHIIFDFFINRKYLEVYVRLIFRF